VKRDPKRHRVKMASNMMVHRRLSALLKGKKCNDKVPAERLIQFRHQKAMIVMGKLEDNICAALVGFSREVSC